MLQQSPLQQQWYMWNLYVKKGNILRKKNWLLSSSVHKHHIIVLLVPIVPFLPSPSHALQPWINQSFPTALAIGQVTVPQLQQRQVGHNWVKTRRERAKTRQEPWRSLQLHPIPTQGILQGYINNSWLFPRPATFVIKKYIRITLFPANNNPQVVILAKLIF